MLAALVCAGSNQTLAQQAPARVIQKIVVATAGDTGVYHKVICPAFQDAVNNDQTNDFKVECQPSGGTVANLEGLVIGQFPAALVQNDVALSYLLGEDKKYAQKISTIGIVGAEALHCVASDIGPFVRGANVWKQIVSATNRKYNVVIDGEKSGTAGTFRILASADSRLTTNTQIEYRPGIDYGQAYGDLQIGIVDLVCFVMAPDPTRDRVALVNASQNLFFVGLYDPAIETYRIGGRLRPYKTGDAVHYAGTLGFGTKKFTTTIIPVMVAVNRSIPPGQSTALQQVLLRGGLMPNTTAGALTDWFAKQTVDLF